MIHKTAMVSLWAVVIGVFVLLSIVQYFVSVHTATVFSVVMVGIAFTFKSCVSFVSAYTMYRQQGTSKLARACHRYFWSMLGMSLLFAILFWLATADSVHIVFPGTDLAEVRNSLRNLAIASIVAVIITGSQMMDALFADLRDQVNRRKGDGLP